VNPVGSVRTLLNGTRRRGRGFLLAIMKRPRKIAGLFSVTLVLVVLGLFLDSRDHIFTVNAVTETASLVTTDGAFSEWRVSGASLLTDPFATTADEIELPENAYLLIRKGSEIDLQRHGTRAAKITLRAKDGRVGSIVMPDADDRVLGSWASLSIVADGRPLVWPFRGLLRVGDDVTSGVDSILLSGTVNILEEQLFRDTRYNAGATELDRGDRIRFWKHATGRAPKEAVVEGFFRIEPSNQESFTEPQNAIQLIAHGGATFVNIERLGSSGYQIKATRWARFLYDPLLAFIAGLGALLFAAIEVYSNIREMIRDARHPDE
jgi:hypothetical protein